MADASPTDDKPKKVVSIWPIINGLANVGLSFFIFFIYFYYWLCFPPGSWFWCLFGIIDVQLSKVVHGRRSSMLCV